MKAKVTSMKRKGKSWEAALADGSFRASLRSKNNGTPALTEKTDEQLRVQVRDGLQGLLSQLLRGAESVNQAHIHLTLKDSETSDSLGAQLNSLAANLARASALMISAWEVLVSRAKRKASCVRV